MGGTFTDAVLRGPSGPVTSTKCLSTHSDPASGIVTAVLAALRDAGVAPEAVGRVVHATTLATNAVLERRGERVAYVTTRGFRSTIPLGRYARVEEDRYDLRFDPPPPPVAAQDCFEVPERIGPRGEVLLPLDEDAVREVAAEIARRGITSVAVCLLHAYADGAHERRVAEILARELPGASIVTSSQVWPEIREYERATTTIMSAYVGPVLGRYLRALRERLAAIGVRAPVYVMESGGGVMSAELAARRAVATIESGPAAGVLAAAATGRPDVISFDMGGTTAKTCVIRNGRPEITREFHVGGKGSFGGRRAGTGVPIKTPAIDLAEVGAGGGSIAWLDAAGTLRVGPRSAGSEPGPACYGLGGDQPTVTDANLVLGYLAPGALAGGTLRLHPELAEKAIDRHLAGPLGVGRAEAAHAVHEIVTASMASAVHVVTVQRGIDPRGFALVAFGGAGPMHAAGVAARFGIGTVVIPAHCGVASAAGLLSGALSTDRVLTRLGAPDPEAVFARLAEDACRDLGVTPGDPGVTVTRTATVRFTGQSHDLPVAWTPDRDELAARFEAEYERVYGIRQTGPIEIVTYHARVTLPPPEAGEAGEAGAAVPAAGSPAPAPGARRAYFPERGGYTAVPVLSRAHLTAAGAPGPLIIEEAGSTIVVPPGWHAARTPGDAVTIRTAP
ncbi:hydantoinase/oxoprolinase family protein [Thermocatellispora tengchongensis]|uniref:hydantoinase/oxoprolinase family protein n=1 Tax=Thermocatellispora tengchongensis TaxID=1073253 RepID=UPI0028A7204D|nr:hydantoinase/oxoprolinase family protein [Thermocatellispora tengchongensis]